MKDTSFIPHGIYCYTWLRSGGTEVCPYWSKHDDKPHQMNGYCSYLERGDWGGQSLSLLWDQCKECGINEDLE